MRALADAGVLTGVTMMPVLPFIEDTPENITSIVEAAHAAGASYIMPAFGLTLRAGSREWYYEKLDKHFPGLKEQYIRRYGERYSIGAPNAHQLERVFYKLCGQYGIPNKMPVFTPEKASKSPLQQSLL
jgi:DNA repair photolyase